MMKIIAISQRVDTANHVGERRDALDQRWWQLMVELGCVLPMILPNNVILAEQLLETIPVNGILLTGGNSLVALEGDAPERDQLDALCIQQAINRNIPLVGVCRGMQSIQDYFGGKFQPLQGHVCQRQQVILDSQPVWVNSYHNWGSLESPSELKVRAIAPDGVIKAIEHRSYPLKGIMWHPEREPALTPMDATFFKETFDL